MFLRYKFNISNRKRYVVQELVDAMYRKTVFMKDFFSPAYCENREQMMPIEHFIQTLLLFMKYYIVKGSEFVVIV
jgi:hypothetical protein